MKRLAMIGITLAFFWLAAPVMPEAKRRRQAKK